MKAVQDEIEQIREEVHAIRVALLGDISRPDTRGALHSLAVVMEDLYKNGFKARMAALEAADQHRKGWLQGAHFVSAIVGGVIASAVPALIKYVFR